MYTRVRLPSKPASELSNEQNLPMLELWELVLYKLNFMYITIPEELEPLPILIFVSP